MRRLKKSATKAKGASPPVKPHKQASIDLLKNKTKAIIALQRAGKTQKSQKDIATQLLCKEKIFRAEVQSLLHVHRKLQKNQKDQNFKQAEAIDQLLHKICNALEKFVQKGTAPADVSATASVPAGTSDALTSAVGARVSSLAPGSTADDAQASSSDASAAAPARVSNDNPALTSSIGASAAAPGGTASDEKIPTSGTNPAALSPVVTSDDVQTPASDGGEAAPAPGSVAGAQTSSSDSNIADGIAARAEAPLSEESPAAIMNQLADVIAEYIDEFVSTYSEYAATWRKMDDALQVSKVQLDILSIDVSEARRLLELPLEQAAFHEEAVDELQYTLPRGHSSSERVYSIQRKLCHLRALLDEVIEEKERRCRVRGVAACFRDGEADEILSGMDRDLRKEGVLQKKVTLGKITRHFFLFDDLMLTGEELKGSRIGTWLFSHQAPRRAPCSEYASASPEASVRSANSDDSTVVGQEAQPWLRKCRTYHMNMASIGYPPRSDPSRFDLHFPTSNGDSDKSVCIWAADEEEAMSWVQALRDVVHNLCYPSMTDFPFPPLALASDSTKAKQIHALLRVYALELSIVSGGPHSVATTRNEESAAAVLGAGHTLDRGIGGATPLHVAVAFGNEVAVNTILNVAETDGAEKLLCAEDDFGIQPLMVALLCCIHGPPPPPPVPYKEGESPSSIDTATEVSSSIDNTTEMTHGTYLRILRRLIRVGAPSHGGCAKIGADSPLLIAIGAGNAEAALALVRGGDAAELRAETVDEQIPAIFLAVQRGMSQVVKAMLEGGVSAADIFPNQGTSALHEAAARADANMVALLLQFGAQPNLLDSFGFRPLSRLLALFGVGDGDGQEEKLCAASATAAALASGGARSELKDVDGSSPALRADGDRRMAATLAAARNATSKLRADRTVPELKASSHPMYFAKMQMLNRAWAEDSSASSCSACARTFTDFARRHHCRLSGALVCDACSSRRAILPCTSSGQSTVRVSDSSYNIIRMLSQVADEERVKDEQATIRASPLPGEAHQRAELLGESGVSQSRTLAPPGASAGKSQASENVREALDALRQRGEKLEQLGDKMDRFRNEAEEFGDLARQLRMREERNARWFPF